MEAHHQTLKPRGKFFRICLVLFVGALCGFVAVMFKLLMALIHNLFFLRSFNANINEIAHSLPSVWGVGVIFVPVVGAMLVTWLINRYASDQRGLSVPEVMYAVRRGNGYVPPLSAFAKTLASAITIGTGGSVGREGPIVQFSSAISSLLSDWIVIRTQQRNVLIAAGAAAGTAAVFNAPLGGMVFAIELLLIEVNAFDVILIALAATVATLISGLFFGSAPIFIIDNTVLELHYHDLFSHVIIFILFGIIIGLLSLLVIYGVYWVEDKSKQLTNNPYLRHMSGMFLVGIMMYVLLRQYGHYYVEGIGFSTIQDALFLSVSNPYFWLVLFVCKWVSTCLSLGTGASGGIFSPSLFLGATVGAAFSLLLQPIFPSLDIHPLYFVVAGMAAMVGSTSGAVVTAIVLTFDMTRTYSVVIPILVTVVVSYLTRKCLCHQSIYTMKLFRRGINLS